MTAASRPTAFVLAVLALLGAGSAHAGPPERGMALVFDEEFDRDPTTTGRWLPMVRKDQRSLNDELELYVDRDYAAPDGTKPGIHPFSVKNGILSIAARPADLPGTGKTYASGALTTEGLFEFHYGYVEIRARFPAGQGLWPCFWLMRSGPTEPYGEIDVAEAVGQDPKSVFATVHAGPTWASRRMFQIHSDIPGRFDRAFHVYGVDWTAKSLTFYLDGKTIGWMSTPPEMKDVAMFPILNLAVGGLAGPPDKRTRFPAVMRVDYLKIWQRVPATDAKMSSTSK